MTSIAPSVVYEVIPDLFDVDSDVSPLASIAKRLDHLVELSVDCLNLTPIWCASDDLRLHAVDHFAIDPKLGTREDFSTLCEQANRRGISVVLMGAFDHVSCDHPWFQEALTHSDDELSYPPEKRTRRFFLFDEKSAGGYNSRGDDCESPSFDLRCAEVRRRLFTGEDSVIHHWLQHGAYGWRLLSADAVGYSILREFRRGALTVEGDHLLVGDIKGFADRYVRDGLLDGVVNHYLREALLSYVCAKAPARQLSRVLRDLSRRYGKMLVQSWNALSTFDSPRLADAIVDQRQLRLGVILSYTLPGTAHIFFGNEVGVKSRSIDDVARPMSWREDRWDTSLLELHQKLGSFRKERIALRDGEFVDMTPEGEDDVIAFARCTSHPPDTVLVVVNRASQSRVRKLFAPVSDLPDGLILRDLFTNQIATVKSGTVTIRIGDQEAMVLVPHEDHPYGVRLFRDY